MTPLCKIGHRNRGYGSRRAGRYIDNQRDPRMNPCLRSLRKKRLLASGFKSLAPIFLVSGARATKKTQQLRGQYGRRRVPHQRDSKRYALFRTIEIPQRDRHFENPGLPRRGFSPGLSVYGVSGRLMRRRLRGARRSSVRRADRPRCGPPANPPAPLHRGGAGVPRATLADR
jgi:hypothetical protein